MAFLGLLRESLLDLLLSNNAASDEQLSKLHLVFYG
jgi:hypothetical protein